MNILTWVLRFFTKCKIDKVYTEKIKKERKKERKNERKKEIMKE